MEQQERRFVGIDLGKRTYELKIINPNGKVTGFKGKTSIQGRQELYSKLQKTDRIAIEVCSLAMIMAKEMIERIGCEVLVLNAGLLPIIYKSTKKTDKEDALKLARLMKTHDNNELPVVTLPTEEELRRRKLLTEYRQLKQSRTKEINRLHAVFVSAGITEIKRKDLATAKSRENCIPLLSGIDRLQAERIIEMLNLEEKQIKILDDIVNKECKGDEAVKKLETVPGVGRLTALAFVSYIGNGERFSNASQVANCIGLVPRIDISCSIKRYGGITKRGCKHLRQLLVLASWALVKSREGGALKEKFDYMVQVQGKNKNKAIIATARKLAELLYTLLKTDKTYEVRISNSIQSLVQQALSA